MLKGKTALVTGSTSGIGLGIATRLAAEGANVVLNGFGDASLIEKLKKELTGKNGVKVAYDPADMTKPGETAEHGITANAICPGYVLTPLVEKQIPDTARARGISEEAVKRDVLLAAQPTKKFVGIDEVAGLAAYLCAAEAASITGAILSIDGGWTAA